MAREDPTHDTCLIALIVGCGVLAGLGYLVSSAARWLL